MLKLQIDQYIINCLTTNIKCAMYKDFNLHSFHAINSEDI